VITRYAGQIAPGFRRDLFAEKVFSERVPFGNTSISPYVFIFDGWDEISLSAAEGFQQRIDRLFDSIRQTFLSQNRNIVRVVLTGRPSSAVGRANFLLDTTPILTILPLRPDQVERYLESLARALANPAFQGSEIDLWKLGNLDRYRPALAIYKRTFPKIGPLEVLGQPLLMHLAFKVMANFEGDLSDLLVPPTTLYRHLVDMTCRRGGKHPLDTSGPARSGRIEGRQLRLLLHGTALAITAHGAESIPKEELELRLETLGVGEAASRLGDEIPITNLMISFYFKGDHELSGCEFLHKSFREYLAAEAIVEILKDHARSLTATLPEKPEEFYWRDFEENDPRFRLSRKLSEALSAQWLTSEVRRHLHELLLWEIRRGEAGEKEAAKTRGVSTATEGISLNAWESLRDSLVDLWDWWGEGVHLRIQPREKQKTWHLDESPYVVELAKLAMRRANYNRRDPPRPPRTVTIDAQLGYSLFVMNCSLHSIIADAHGWSHFGSTLDPAVLWANVSHRRRYQVTVTVDNKEFTRFAPSGKAEEYFWNYCARINGAGVVPLRWPRLDFPRNAQMSGVYLRRAVLDGLGFERTDLSCADLSETMMHQADLSRARLVRTHLKHANMFAACCVQARLDGADMTMANLYATDLRVSSLEDTIGLSEIQLRQTGLAFCDTSLPAGLQSPPQWQFWPSSGEDE